MALPIYQSPPPIAHFPIQSTRFEVSQVDVRPIGKPGSGSLYAISTTFPKKFDFGIFSAGKTAVSELYDDGVSCTFRRYSHFETLIMLFQKQLELAANAVKTTKFASFDFFQQPSPTTKTMSAPLSAFDALKLLTTKGNYAQRPDLFSKILTRLHEAYFIQRDACPTTMMEKAEAGFCAAMTALVGILDDFYYPIVRKLSFDTEARQTGFLSVGLSFQFSPAGISWKELKHPLDAMNMFGVFDSKKRVQHDPTTYKIDKVASPDVEQTCFFNDKDRDIKTRLQNLIMLKNAKAHFKI